MVMQSEKIDLLSAALVKFQGAMPPVPESSRNPFYESTYADLADIVRVAQPHLLDNGLAVTQWPGHTVLVTRVHHESGQWLSGEMDVFMDKETSQAQGSALTYSRRYAYCAALGIVTGKDDDGNAAGQEGRKAEQPKPVDPEADKMMAHLAQVIRSTEPGGEREKLVSHLRGLYGPSTQMNPTQLANAIEIAEKWQPLETSGSAPSDEEAEPEALLEGEKF